MLKQKSAGKVRNHLILPKFQKPKNQTFMQRLSFLLLTVLLAGGSLRSIAQPITGQQIKDQFIIDWERAKAYTLDYLNTMPADKYSFKAVDSIRSFASQMLHLAGGNVGLITAATGAKIQWPGRGLENSPTAQNKDSVVWYVTRSYDFALESIKALDPDKYAELVDFAKRKEMRYTLLWKAFEHQTHHRGQTTIYIRLQGIRPPNERLF
jgi:uncharacterized damage-inducible protein DinB